MSKVLAYSVHVDGVHYRPGTTPPEDVIAKITNPRAFRTAVAPADGDAAQSLQPPADPGAPAEYPDGAPDDTWTVKDLRAWAKAHDVVLGEAKNKPDILKVVAAATAGQEPGTPEAPASAEPLGPADPSGEDQTTPEQSDQD